MRRGYDAIHPGFLGELGKLLNSRCYRPGQANSRNLGVIEAC